MDPPEGQFRISQAQFSSSLPTDPRALEAPKTTLLSEVKTPIPVSRAEPKKWSLLVRLGLGQRDRETRNTVSMEENGKGRGNREVNMWKTCRAGWRRRDHCEETWVRVAL